MNKLLTVVLSATMLLLTCNVFAMSFVYDGFECEGSQSPSTIPKQSKFEVIEDLGNGAYRILFTGGLPLFSISTGPCVGDAFGVETTETSEGKQVKKIDSQAMAYFTGTHLIITLSTLNSLGEGQILGGFIVMSSFLMPQTYTWVFEFIPQETSFRLLRNIDIRGTVNSTATVTPSPGEIIELITLSAPITAIPAAIVEYRIEN